jgi:hypothetical protein
MNSDKSKLSTETKRLKKPDGTVAYMACGKLHNIDGPALIPPGIPEAKGEYYLFGIKHSKEEWIQKKKAMIGDPFYKTSVGKASGARV